MLVGVQGAGVDVDVGVEFLNSDLIAACLQQAADAGGDDALPKRGNHAARNEDVLCVHKMIKIIYQRPQLVVDDEFEFVDVVANGVEVRQDGVVVGDGTLPFVGDVVGLLAGFYHVVHILLDGGDVLREFFYQRVVVG